MPTLAIAETKVRPAGSRSVTTTPVALLGPLLVAVMVKVTLVFRFGVELSTVLVMAMSADTGVMVAQAEVVAGDRVRLVFSAVLVAVLVVGAVVLTVAVMARVALAPLARAPMFQIPLPEL